MVGREAFRVLKNISLVSDFLIETVKSLRFDEAYVG